ncbi:hypothetical protein Pmani_007419 [Petrolisthes manimaculis]|uniref:Uncharacterized protein n=1 Tax=Petrolisthes manimaculis TaxID=1843537 RepID=A0AAE1QAX1_9EUCA|nr:hypothetical protein Pmani_007419 [Petrolisthes manimaculis]
MIPLLLTALLLALAHCEPLLEPMEELESMDMNMGYENEVMKETYLDQKEGQSVVEERQFISATAVCPSGCCTQGSKCEKLGGECQPLSSLQWCHHASTDPDLCGSSKCRCCLKCSCGSYCGKVYGTCRPECGCSMYEYADVFNPCPAPNGCTCCRRCLSSGTRCQKEGKDYGICVGDVKSFLHYHNYYYAGSLPCKEDKCRCVHYCGVTSLCSKHKGRCLRKGVKCPTGFTSFSCWCKNESTCHCCIPTKTAKNLSLKCTS